MCSQGSCGPLCGSCAGGYAYSSSLLKCYPCDKIDYTLWFILIPFFCLVCAIMILIKIDLIQVPKIIAESYIVGVMRKLDTGTLKIVFSTYQIVQSVTYSMDIIYPAPFSVMINGLNVISIVDLPGLECSGVGIYGKVILVTIAPVLVALLIIAAYLCRLRWVRLMSTTSENEARIRSQHAWMLLFLSYIIVPPVSLLQFQALDCYEFSKTDGSRYLRIDMNVDCDTNRHFSFVFLNGVLICLVLCIPIVWVILLRRSRHRLFPPGVTDELTIVTRRQQDEQLASLRFLFDCYRVDMVYWETFEMMRRVVFVGVVPLMSTTTLGRSAIGLVISLAMHVSLREFVPYNHGATNTLACIAQLTILLTYGGSLVLETDLANGLNDFVFGVVLCAVNSVVIGFAFGAAWMRNKQDRRAAEIMMENAIKKVEWAVGFTATKFDTTFDSLIQTSIPPSHCLAFYYGSIEEIKHMVRCGVPVENFNSVNGTIFTLHRPHDIDEDDEKVFQNRSALVVCSIPRRLLLLLHDAPEGSRSGLRCLPSRIIQAMRGSYFKDIPESKQWENGYLFVPPHCIIRAFQLSRSNDEQTQLRVQKRASLMNKFGEINPWTSFIGDIGLMQRSSEISNADHGNIGRLKTVTDCESYVNDMNLIRERVSEDLVLLYHYTTAEVALIILKGGFRMSTQGQGDGGVYFSTLGPASYDLGSPNYEDNIIVDCYGKERLEEYRGKHKLDVCLVYAVDPLMVEQAPGGRDNAKMVTKPIFEAFSLPHPDGCYYLGPARIMGAFLIDPAIISIGNDESLTRIQGEQLNDNQSQHLLFECEKSKLRNELLVKICCEKLKPKIEVEEAVGFSPVKFSTTFVSIREHSVPTSHCLLFFYCSMNNAHAYVRSGIPAQKNGIIFTKDHPHNLSNDAKQCFQSQDCVLVCSLPKRCLQPLMCSGNESSLSVLSKSLLESMRSTCFDELPDPRPWMDGGLFLPPGCILRAYQVLETPDAVLSQKKTHRSIDRHVQDADSVGRPPISLRSNTYSVYLEIMSSVRKRCTQENTVPLYHFTSQTIAPFILQAGFRMSTQGQGDGGVYFSTLGPASYDLGSPNYEDNIIVDCYGKERLEEYRGKHKLDVCLVYAVDPLMVEQAPGGRDNAKMVTKPTFEAFSLPHPDGCYYLNPARIMGAFIFDPLSLSRPTENEDILLKNEILLDSKLKEQFTRMLLSATQPHPFFPSSYSWTQDEANDHQQAPMEYSEPEMRLKSNSLSGRLSSALPAMARVSQSRISHQRKSKMENHILPMDSQLGIPPLTLSHKPTAGSGEFGTTI